MRNWVLMTPLFPIQTLQHIILILIKLRTDVIQKHYAKILLMIVCFENLSLALLFLFCLYIHLLLPFLLLLFIMLM